MFRSYDRTYKQINRDHYFIYVAELINDQNVVLVEIVDSKLFIVKITLTK